MSNAATAAPGPSLAPYLFYDDVERAAGFMQEAFGFMLVFTSPDPASGLAHAQLAHGSGRAEARLAHNDGARRSRERVVLLC
jgi:uncharacterized glyoxalase superfamily protein PhnB